MGFFTKLFGGFSASEPVNAQLNARSQTSWDDPNRLGGPSRPWVCEPPPNISEVRKLVMDRLAENKNTKAMIPSEGANPAALDPMIAEMLKMAFLNEIFGEEGKDWECGERLYLEGSIQTQVILFKDGRPPLTFYADFSKFGAF